MAKSEFDKQDGKGKKRGRPRVASEEKPRKSAAERAAEKEEKEKQATKEAKKALRKAVKAEVKKRSEGIARTLVDRTEQGDMRSTTVVLSLIEKQKGDEGPERHGGLTAADLAGSEEEWEGGEAENREQGLGNRDQRTEVSSQGREIGIAAEARKMRRKEGCDGNEAHKGWMVANARGCVVFE